MVSWIEKVLLLKDGRFVVVASKVFPDETPDVSFRAALFSPDGNMLFPLFRIGNGPEEVINVQDVQLNHYKNSIDVLYDFGRKILRFDMGTQKIAEIVPIDSKEIVCGESFLPLEDNKVLIYKNISFTQDREYKLYLYDASSGKVLNRFLPFDKQTAEVLSEFGQRNNLSRVANDALFSEVFLDTIYKFNGDELYPLIGFESNRYSLPEELLHKFSRSERLIDYAVGASKIYFHGSFFLSGGEVYSSFKYLKDQTFFNVVSIEEQNSISYDRIYDDICTGVSALCTDYVFSVVGADSEHVVFRMETEQNPTVLIMQN